MLDDKTKEILQNIVDSIEQAAIEDDQEMLLEAIERIPEDFWKDSECSMTIMESFFSRIGSDFFVYPIKFIPESFWEDEDLAWKYVVTLSSYYQDSGIDYNMSELFPLKLLGDKQIAKLFLYANYIETIGDIPKELMEDHEMICEALDGIDFAIEQHEDLGSMVCPLNAGQYLQALLDQIPDESASNKDFVSEIISDVVRRSCICDEIDVLFNWIAPQLKSDKEFVVQCLKNDPGEYGYLFELASDELKHDKKFVWDCLAINFAVFECISDELVADKEFIMGCLKNHHDEYEFIIGCVSAEMREDEEFKKFVREHFKVDSF